MAFRHIPSTHLYRIIAQTIGPTLHDRGFRPADKRTWVRGFGTNEPIRAIITFTPPGSWIGSYPMWGFDLSYVPDVSSATNYRIQWPSSPAQFKFDLAIQPPEHPLLARPSTWRIPTDSGEDAARSAAQPLLAQLHQSTFPQLDAVQTIADLPAAFESPFRHRLGTSLWPREMLAYAFTLAKLGHAPQGRDWLERFITHDRLMPHETRRALRSLYEGAS